MKRAHSRLAGAWLLAAMPGLGIGLAVSGQAAGDAAERERIAIERAAVETRFAEQRLACQQNFVVTSCVDEVRRKEREALGSLRRQEVVLDETQRRQRAAERVAAIRAKVSAEEERQRDSAATPRSDRPPTVAARAAPVARAASTPRPAATPVPTAAERESREARSRERFETRQSEARERREAAQRRTVQRTRQGHQATPLPPAGPASSP